MNWYIKVLRNYAVFEGRARRKEYWFFVLFNAIALTILGIIDSMLWGGVTESLIFSFNGDHTNFSWRSRFTDDWEILSNIYALGVLIPSIAVGIRRLHDTNHSGWWLLFVFVPIAGWLVLFIFMVTAGDTGKNRFGPDPKKESPPPGLFAATPPAKAKKRG